MRIELTPKLHPRRGGKVKVGNVYTNPHGKQFYKIVVAVGEVKDTGRYKNVICLHVDSAGAIVGASTNPEAYISDHQDLVGTIKNMPTLKIEWNKEP